MSGMGVPGGAEGGVGMSDDGGGIVSEKQEDSAKPSVSGVRPIQMGEFLRKWVGKRLQAVAGARISAAMGRLRQYGVGVQGGMEALALFHQLLYRMWSGGTLARPLVRIKVDEKNCFGSLEWDAVRRAMRDTLPHMQLAVCYKHRWASHVEMGEGGKLAKDRGAEQGDVDGPLEAAVTLGRVAVWAKEGVHDAQKRGEADWVDVANRGSRGDFEADWSARKARQEAWEGTTPAERERAFQNVGGGVDPGAEVQLGGGVYDVWYLDDGQVVLPARFVGLFDHHLAAAGSIGAARGNFTSVAQMLSARSNCPDAQWASDTL